MMTTMVSSELESIKKELFTFAMKGRWEQVMKMYQDEPRAHRAKITRSGDTALHLAVSEAKDKVVEEMVRSVSSHWDEDQLKKVLQTDNIRGNTALHLAATMGDVRKCEIIAKVEPSLVDCRNGDGETPLFLAAHFGKTKAFLCLHYIRNPNLTDGNTPPYNPNCRRNDGDTILHCAINGDYFDLAFQIIHLYEDLVTSVNEDGLSPLHLLAAKPSAFRSGSRLGRVESIIYHCIYVDQLKKAEPLKFYTEVKEDQPAHFPPNYRVLWDAFNTVIKFKSTVTGPSGKSMAGGKENEPQANSKDLENARNPHTAAGAGERDHGSRLFPANYRTCFNFVRFFYLALLVILGEGSSKLNKIRRKKEKHTWSVQIMHALLNRASDYEYEDNGSKPDDSPILEDLPSFGFKPSPAKDGGVEECEKRKKEPPILIAAKNGVIEMVKEIRRLFPVAIYDENEEKKNIVLLAVEKRQPHVYKLLLENNFFKESLFRQVDHEGNSALHLAAKSGSHEPWRISGAALQMQWEIKWYEFVKNSMPPHFFAHYNKSYKTPKQIFTETHSELVQKGGEWLTKTSESCSVVATLVATVAFTSSTAVPGGLEEATGRPLLRAERAFDLFTISSLVALCFSIIATIMFLSILTSRYQEFDFNRDLPKKLILGMSSLFMSIASMLMSFCAGHFFVLKDQFQDAALPIYLLTSFPVTLFALAQFPLYFDLLKTTLKKVPQRSYKATPVMELQDSEAKKNNKNGEEGQKGRDHGKGSPKSNEKTSTGDRNQRNHGEVGFSIVEFSDAE
ncbi:uncharacterized protein LOC114717476 [Neltuma alba]|uniref:uncharacterized protein LOC114717476 n=1 Tax=Neltuma alba TaxID=207710 RepID=UPI0010A5575C|nr:uncharacterized protein LOC114717476 [Prosopis alba]